LGGVGQGARPPTPNPQSPIPIKLENKYK